MDLDWSAISIAASLLAFNLPIVVVGWMTFQAPDLTKNVGALLKEKDSAGDPTSAVSYSRVSGAVGAVMVGSLFWVICNIAIVTAIARPSELSSLLTSTGKLFLVGAALFLPYAFNQLKSVLQ